MEDKKAAPENNSHEIAQFCGSKLHQPKIRQRSLLLWKSLLRVNLHLINVSCIFSEIYAAFMVHAALLRTIFPCGRVGRCPLFHGFLFQFLLFSISLPSILFSWLVEHLNKDRQDLCHWCKSHHTSSSGNIMPQHDPYSYTDKNLHHLHGF